MNLTNPKIILASASPRRRELLKELVDDFLIVTSDVDETCDIREPHEKVEELARRKASAIDVKDALIVASDTLVFDGYKPLGKPKNRNDAFDMLCELSGRIHQVYTAVCLKYNDETIVFYDKTDVEFNHLSTERINRYISEYDPLDKAGAYGIQDGVCVKKIHGSYSTVVGLPQEKLKKYLTEIGVKIKE